MGAFSQEEWLQQVPESIKNDPLWGFHVYPKTVLLADLVWEDTGRMMKDARGRAIAGQLVRSVGSICANLEEGHGRGFGKENAYFQRVALGSARESRGWYYRGRHLLDAQVSQHSIKLLDEIIAALVLSCQQQRQYYKR
jgi:four helix bundle protein